jgi:hypothetical protein
MHTEEKVSRPGSIRRCPRCTLGNPLVDLLAFRDNIEALIYELLSELNLHGLDGCLVVVIVETHVDGL